MYNQTTYFCYLTITDSTQFILNLVIIGLSLSLLILTAYKFYQLRGSHNRSTAFVYSMLFLWWFTFAGSIAFSAWIYEQYMPKQQMSGDDTYFRGSVQDNNDEQMSTRSKYLYMADWFNAYCVQLLMLYVTYRWCKNINILFNGNDSEVSRTSSALAVRTSDLSPAAYTGIETKIQPLLLIYIKIRFLQLVLPILFIIIDQPIFFKALFFCFLLDCLIVFLSLLIGMISVKTSQQLIESLDEDQRKRIFNQYSLMAIATVIRTGFDIFFLVNNVINDHFYQASCPMTSEKDSSFGVVIFTIAVSFFGDFFPVFIILRIYTLEEKPEEMCQSLIITTAALNDQNSIKE